MKPEKNMKRIRGTAAATPDRMRLLESWEQIYLYALRADEVALARKIADHVKLCRGVTSTTQIRDTLHHILTHGGYAAALTRVRNAIEKAGGSAV